MAVLTPKQALDVCYEAGFRWNQGIVIMPAIGWAESRLRTDARGYNRDASGKVLSIDRGWLQINTVHKEISDADCDDPLKAAQFAFKLSNQGTKFTPWSAFNSGAYRGPEGLTYALFLAEWRDKAGRMKLAEAEAALIGVKSELAKARANEERLAAEVGTWRTSYYAFENLANERQARIDAARAALG